MGKVVGGVSQGRADWRLSESPTGDADTGDTGLGALPAAEAKDEGAGWGQGWERGVWGEERVLDEAKVIGWGGAGYDVSPP